ncbi:hypothetical protein [Oleiagrimonas sp. C23AA]|uniref:hypothetical protein n=1 Tax=Oleiagrimonas sp. C23AA TaxID=2719047 RepID=UPI00141F4A19|nr:hypothetical protein [Oleiagrimonas sp. C23AA]NII09697.1 hypothetical protein [Oleiagrimonas sp. C23AA]
MRAAWQRRLWKLARWLLLVALLLALFRPELQLLAPMLTDVVSAVGVDGLLMLIEMQVVLVLSGIAGRTVIPWLTQAWNRHMAMPRGLAASDNVLADGLLWLFHQGLCRGGRKGLALYLVYIALHVHLSALAAPPMA